MEHINQFSRGLFTDLPAISQPEGTYVSLWNAIRTTDGSPKNERGTSLIASLGGLSIVGSTVLDEEVILCLTNGIKSQIAVLDTNDTLVVYLDNSTLNFSLDPALRVDMEAKKDFRGHRLIYLAAKNNPLRRLDLDEVSSIPVDKLDKNISLFLKYSMPEINLNAVTEDGSLPTGVYQFAARLLTDNMNKTAFSFITDPIKIVNESKSVGNKRYDGSVPQSKSNKAISIDISNVDLDYKYIEVCAITYEGTANISKASIVGLLPVTDTTVNFIYSSTDQDRESIDITELVQDYAYYDTAEHVLQKDGRLIFANLTTEEEDLDFQAVANEISITWHLEPLDDKLDINIRTKAGALPSEDIGAAGSVINGYRNEVNASTRVGYQRGEAYSFALVPIFKGRKFGNAYHIPATTAPGQGSTPNGKWAHTGALCGVKTSTLKYPQGLGYPDEFISYHVMPDVNNAPLVDDNENIQVLAIKESTPNFTPEMLEKLEGYVIVRRHRDDFNKTIMSQGIAQPMIGAKDVAPVDDSLIPSPFTGKGPHIEYFSDDTWSGKGKAYRMKDVTFHSPETILLEKDLSSAVKLEAVAELRGTITCASAETAASDDAGKQYWAGFLHYNKVVGILPQNRNVISNSMVYVPEDLKPTIDNLSVEDFYVAPSMKKYARRGNYGYFALSLDGDIPMTNVLDVASRPEFYWDIKEYTDDVYLRQPDGQGKLSYTGVTTRYLYNLVANRPSQYGNIYDAQYMYVGHRLFNKPSNGVFYGGDTYINRFAVQHNAYDLMNYKPGVSGADGRKYYALNYFYCESTTNVAYRHYLTEGELDQDGVAGTVPYFPKYPKLWADDKTGLMQVYYTLKHPRGYNKQYSFVNNIRTFFPKQLGQVDVNNYSNRLIYSDLNQEGERADSYRTFLVNDYHDIPRNKGAITDIFDHGGALYIHTEQTLFKASFNERTTQATSTGDIVLGNGGLFPIPSKEVLTVDGGYAGTSHKWASCSTPFGRFFVDKIQGKVFMLGEGLKEISDQGMFEYFAKNLQDIPMVSGYDFLNKRWILSSYKQELKSEHAANYKGVYNTDPTFISSLEAGDIVLKEGKYLRIL